MPSCGRNHHRHQIRSSRTFRVSALNRAPLRPWATANADTFSKSNSLTAPSTVISMCLPRFIATSCRRNQKRGSTIPKSDGITAPFWFSRGKRVNLGIEVETVRELKKVWRFRFDEVRQRFRLTPTEKRVAVFVVAAFVLGLATKCYRDAHSSPPPPARKMEQANSIKKTKAKRASPKPTAEIRDQ